MASRKPELKEVPNVVRNEKGVIYQRGRFLGKGGFGRCYELISPTKEVFAGKIVSKELLVKQYQKDKMAQEITIHRDLIHPHVVRLFTFFEDSDNVYILLELCSRRSLLEMHKRRTVLTEPETRCLTWQIADGIEYLHKHHIIHRDLKLGNVFLNADMMIKIGDFGLATVVTNDGERKRTLCGTPNYIAPEVLEKKGHSYEVDSWAIGCIVYTLLVGRPPFETRSLKETYSRIKTNSYSIPSAVNGDAAKLIKELLAADPTKRPTMTELKKYEFFCNGYMPTRLPASCLTMEPKFDQHMREINRRVASSSRTVLTPRQLVREDMMQSPGRPLLSVPEDAPCAAVNPQKVQHIKPKDLYALKLREQICKITQSENLRALADREDDAEAPECLPVYWISKWVDYSDKYGIGYQLCDNSIGVLFNDSSKLVLDAAGVNMQYVERDDAEEYYDLSKPTPNRLEKKVTLLKYFRTYMNEHLLKAGEKFAPKEGDELARLPCLHSWFRTRSAIVLQLSNGTLQINFFLDHTKLILDPLVGSITYIDQHKTFRTFKFSLLEEHGCWRDLRSRLIYAYGMIERLIARQSTPEVQQQRRMGSAQSIARLNSQGKNPPIMH